LGSTVKLALLLVTLLIWTTTGPVVVDGTVVRILVSLQLVGIAETSLNDTLMVPGLNAVPNPDPLIVTALPTYPLEGATPEIVGISTVKLKLLLLTPLIRTTTGPLVVEGTGAWMLVSLQLVGVV